jgi:hypothetical protein
VPGREEVADQLGSPLQTALFGRTRRCDFDLDLLQHPRQRDGEREEEAV